MTPQTPPTDRPLTAGDVPLLREGDVLRCEGVDVSFTHSTLGVVHYLYDAAAIGSAPPQIFTFVSRPATSAASEDGVWQIVSEIPAINDLPAQVQQDIHDAILAALASPPVSERERELEGALGLIADGWGVIESSGSMGEMTLQAPDDWEGDQTEIVVKFHGLTAQPAGEGK